jgi:hypothetical protein
MQEVEARFGLAVPGRSIGPWPRRTGAPQAPRPDGTGPPARAGSVAHRDHRARAVSNGHHGQRRTAGHLASDSGSRHDADGWIRLWSRRPGVRVPYPTAAGLRSLSTRQVVTEDRPHPSRIRHKIGCALVIPMIIQTILLSPSGPDWIDAASNLSRHDPTSAVQSDTKHLARNRKVVGSVVRILL